MLMTLPISDSLQADSLVTLTLPSHYGYCILVTIGSICVIKWKYWKIEKARKTYSIPNLLVSSDEDEDAHVNNLLRAYQNTLEHYPQFLALLLLGGLENPITSAVGGAIYLLGRIYYSGDPEEKNQMYFGEIGMLTMLGTTFKLALKLLQIV